MTSEVYGLQGGGLGEFISGSLYFIEAPKGFEPGDLVPRDCSITCPFDYNDDLKQIVV